MSEYKSNSLEVINTQTRSSWGVTNSDNSQPKSIYSTAAERPQIYLITMNSLLMSCIVKPRKPIHSQLREKADDFAGNFRKSIQWARTKRDFVNIVPEQAIKYPLIRSPSTDSVASRVRHRPKLERRHSSAFL